MTKQFNNLKRMQKYYDEKSNTYIFMENGRYIDTVVFTFDLDVGANIDAANIKARNIFLINLSYITIRYFTKIKIIAFLTIFIPFGRKHAFTAERFKCISETTDTSK